MGGGCGIPEEDGVKRKLIAAIGIAGMMVSIAACGDDNGSGDSKGTDAKELTVWLTVDAQNNWPELVKAADAAVQKKHPGVKITHEYYGWPDKNAKLDTAKYTASVIPNAKLSVYDGIGHSPFYEDAARFNRELAAFVRMANKAN